MLPASDLLTLLNWIISPSESESNQRENDCWVAGLHPAVVPELEHN
ncbi:hypothetical protein F3H79_05340 [Citrobacter freundii]|nr:hypothetical protein [Citrobacter sp. RHBSTW-01065]MBE8729375.1 hypothetical protein [Citrobacter freundii]